MIGRLRGILVEKKLPVVLIDVQGVGYEIFVPLSTVDALPELGQEVVLVTHFQVREDQQTLYGFHSEREREVFRALIKVSGVGPKMALAILSGMNVAAFVQCVEQREIAALTRLPGVGKKTAERLVVEMAGKLPEIDAPAQSREVPAEEEAAQALEQLGYKAAEAMRLVRKVAYPGADSAALIRCALQSLG